MTRSTFLTLLALLALSINGCVSGNEAPAAPAGADVRTSLIKVADEVDAKPVVESLIPTATPGPDVLLVAPGVLLEGNWTSFVKPGSVASGRYELRLHSEHVAEIHLTVGGGDPSSETTIDTLRVEAPLEQVSDLWNPSLAPDDGVAGRFEMKLLPSDEVLIRLTRQDCE